jgi:hypothetical protein
MNASRRRGALSTVRYYGQTGYAMTVTVDNAVADLQRRLDEALAERDDALERETATAEVLQGHRQLGGLAALAQTARDE